MTCSFDHIKEQFPIFSAHPNLVYLDSAATSHRPEKVISAIAEFERAQYGTVHRAVYQLAQEASTAYDLARQEVQGFLGAKSTHEIIFTKGTTESINLLSEIFCRSQAQHGGEILVPVIEHHSNLVPWQEACQRYGLELKILPVEESGDINLETLDHYLSEKTRLLALAHVSNVLGSCHPLEAIISRAHAQGALVFVDAAQSIAHSPLDVQALDIDFLAFSGHKIYGPTGIGILYGKESLLAKLPPYQTGGSMIEKVTPQASNYLPPPLRFEAGTPPITQAIGLQAALAFLSSFNLSHIHAYENTLIEALLKGLSSIPKVNIIGSPSNRGSLVSFAVEGIHPLDIASFLDLRHIAVRSGHLCAQPALAQYQLEHVLRASVGIYNTQQEIDTFLNHLEDVICKLS